MTRHHRLAWVRPFVVGSALAAFGGAALATSCGGSPTVPTDQLQISCPASKSVESPSGNPVAVDFGTPTATGGSAPLTVGCTPSSGSNFPTGPTSVVCTARDAKQHTASCGLNVTVTQVGMLSATRFMAFGDSITEGKLSSCSLPITTAIRGTRAYMLADFKALKAAINNPTSYPSVLRDLLLSRYATQSPVVINEGLAGEEVLDVSGGTNDDTLDRLRARLQADVPEVLLLQEGVNDLNENPLHPDIQGPRVVKALHDMIVLANSRGVKKVYFGTLLPQQPGACRGYAPDSIAPTNTLIRAQALADGAVLVDLYQAFGGTAALYIGPDGLHPNDDGYRKIAETFRDSIKATLEVPR